MTGRSSYVLSSMSRQMIHLGRPDDALELIHLAQYGSPDRPQGSERVNTRIRKTVDTAVRDFGDLAEVTDLTERLAAELPETAEAV
ncbi:NsdA OS=Streptomyces fumanus OX=67302 GN=GCM10018772_53050 PE=4 SV=1 [Streptomyces fumanus]